MSVMSNLMIIASESYVKELMMDGSTKRQSSAISDHSSVTGTPKVIREWLMSLPQVSRVSHSVPPENSEGGATSETCGPQHSKSFAWLDRDSRCWRTWQGCLLTNTFEPFLESWPKAGLMQGGECYPQQKWERRISEIGCGYSFPTPTTTDCREMSQSAAKMAIKKGQQVRLAGAIRLWPTPSATDFKGSPSLAVVNARAETSPRGVRLPEHVAKVEQAEVGGKLNPMWVEWLMGWPIGWTDLKPLAMDKFLPWRQKHGGN